MFILANATKKGEKDSTELNRTNILEMKYRITRIEVDYSSSNLILRQDVKKSNCHSGEILNLLVIFSFPF
jgi:hypothetical protein